MCVHVYVCVHVCMCARVYVHMYVCMCAHVCVHVCMCICMFVHMMCVHRPVPWLYVEIRGQLFGVNSLPPSQYQTQAAGWT